MKTDANLAIVTGGSVGIGKEICHTLVDEGYRVVNLSRRRPDWSHARLDTIEVDLTDASATADAAREASTRGAITHVIHNAGVIRAKLVEQVEVEDISELAQLHLASALQLVQAALPAMKAQKFGRIILVSSRAALGLATRTAYSATKAGMMGLARTWALELGPHGITSNVVAPGPIEGTEMFHEVLPHGDPRIGALAASIPVKRLGTPEDVTNAVMFFASRSSGFITGQVLYVCGGASIGTVGL
jgi:NAD(P)-dependent dehydrogenase (short-subunit alcohol dehydrogenase family)